MPITGGEVTFSQSRKLAEYENRSCSITFNVTDAAGAEGAVIAAGAIARGYVFAQLGIPDPDLAAHTAAATAAKNTGAAKTIKAKAPVVVVDSAKAPAVKADPAAVIEDATIVVEETARQISTGAERVDPADVNEDFAAAAPEISDKALHDACAAKKQKLGTNLSPPAPMLMIQKLMGEFLQPGQSLAQIPQPARAAFLKKLEALVP